MASSIVQFRSERVFLEIRICRACQQYDMPRASRSSCNNHMQARGQLGLEETMLHLIPAQLQG